MTRGKPRPEVQSPGKPIPSPLSKATVVAGVITLIKDDHKKLESVFKKLESAEPSQVPDLLQQVAELLIPHSKAEEQVVYPTIKSAAPEEESDVDDGIAEHHHVEEVLEQLSLNPWMGS